MEKKHAQNFNTFAGQEGQEVRFQHLYPLQLQADPGMGLMSGSHCQVLCRQQACWLLIGWTRVNNHPETRSAS